MATLRTFSLLKATISEKGRTCLSRLRALSLGSLRRKL